MSEGTEVKRTIICSDFDQKTLKLREILYPFKQNKIWGVALTASWNLSIFVDMVWIFPKKCILGACLFDLWTSKKNIKKCRPGGNNKVKIMFLRFDHGVWAVGVENTNSQYKFLKRSNSKIRFWKYRKILPYFLFYKIVYWKFVV